MRSRTPHREQLEGWRSHGRGRRLVAIAGALLVWLAALPVGLPVSAAAADGDDNDFPIVAKIPIFNQDGEQTAAQPPFLLDEADRKLLLPNTGSPKGVAVVDVDELVQEAFIPLPDHPQFDGSDSDDAKLLAHDQQGDRLFYATDMFANKAACFGEGQSSVACQEAATARGTVHMKSVVYTVTLDGDEATVSSYTLPVEYRGHESITARYDVERQILLVATEARITGDPATRDAANSLGGRVTVHAITDDQLASGSSDRPLWSYPVPGCTQLLHAGAERPAFLGIGSTGDFAYTACVGFFPEFASMAIVPSGAVRIDFNGADIADVGASAAFTSDFFPFPGKINEDTFAFGDPAGDRVVTVVRDPEEGFMSVFDARHRAWTGRVTMESANYQGGDADVATGRLYFLDDDRGWVVFDGAALPVAQGAAHRPDHADGGLTYVGNPAFDPQTRRLFQNSWAPNLKESDLQTLQVWEDRSAPRRPAPPEDPDAGTHDIDEALAAQVNHGGSATAYGSRLMWVGGPGMYAQAPDKRLQPAAGDRGLFLGQVIHTELAGDRSGGTAAARALSAAIDEATEQDLEEKPSAPFAEAGQAPPAELTWGGRKEETGALQESECTDRGGEDDVRSDGHDGSTVACSVREEVRARAVSPEMVAAAGLQVGHASSDTRTVLDPEGRLVSEATAVARDVALTMPGAGSLYIGEITSTARSWATGRPATADHPERGAASEHEVEMRNVAILGADGEGFTCGDDCDPVDVVRAINDQYPAAHVRADGPRAATDEATTGSPGGAQASIRKDEYAFMSDLLMQGDGQHEVYGLQLSVLADKASASRMVVQLAAVATEAQYRIGAEAAPVEPLGPASLVVELLDDLGEPLAGGMFEVRVDPTGGTAPAPPPEDSDEATDGEATDGEATDGEATDGDGFQAQSAHDEPDGENGDGDEPDGETGDGDETEPDGETGDGDETEPDGENGDGDGTGDGDPDGNGDEADQGGGVPGLDDELIEGGVCVTEADGVGSCTFENLEPGSYTITQTAAPDGYFGAPDPLAVSVDAGYATSVSFTNLRAVGGIEINLSDDLDPPEALAGGEFALLAGGTDEVARCTTGPEGTCGFADVALDDYVVRQTAAPPEYQAADDIAFALTEPGQVAVVRVVNGLEAIAGSEAVAAGSGATAGGGSVAMPAMEPISYRPGPTPPPPTVSRTATAPTPPRSGFGQILAAPGEVFGFIAHRPAESLLIIGVWLLFAAPAYLAARRRSLAIAKGVT